MKYAIAAAAVAALFAVSSPASAEDNTYYGSVGYSGIDYENDLVGTDTASLGAVTVRAAARFSDMNIGLEAEGSFGIDDDAIGTIPVELDHSYGLYGVAYLPGGENTDLLIRIGYSRSSATIGGADVSDDSWNWGVGAQHFFKGGNNGIRLDWTRYELDGADDSDAITLSYVRRFR
jgi:hypothetical protein